MTPAESFLLAIFLFVAIEAMGMGLIIYWMHDRKRVLKEMEEKLNELARIGSSKGQSKLVDTEREAENP